jgi:hypothetical protein
LPPSRHRPLPQVAPTLAPRRRYPLDIWSSSPLTHIDASLSGALSFPDTPGLGRALSYVGWLSERGRQAGALVDGPLGVEFGRHVSAADEVGLDAGCR